MRCSEDGCKTEAAFELHIPWTENRRVCAAHARTKVREEGVVAEPLETAGEDLPEGATQA